MIENPNLDELEDAYYGILGYLNNPERFPQHSFSIDDIIEKHITMFEDPKLPNAIKFISWCDAYKETPRTKKTPRVAARCTAYVLRLAYTLNSRNLTHAVITLAQWFAGEDLPIPFHLIWQATSIVEEAPFPRVLDKKSWIDLHR